MRWVIDGKVQLTMDARFGSTVNDTPTREGLFHVYFMNADHVSKLYGTAMPYAMFFSGGQAVHYSSDFATVGYYGASHGCVNIRDYDGVKWLFSPGAGRRRGRRLLVVDARPRSRTGQLGSAGPRAA